MYDAVVVGAGPGGLYLGRILAQQGFQVAIMEEHLIAGTPVHCTGVLASEAFKHFDLPRHSILNSLSHVQFFAPSGGSFDYVDREAETVVIDRTLFDSELMQEAKDAGCQLITETRVQRIEVGGKSARIFTSGASGKEAVQSRVAILACGADYGLQRSLGMGVPRTFLQTAQIEVPAHSVGNVELHFGQEVAPQGFAWTVPVKRATANHVRVGIMTRQAADKYFQLFVSRIATRWGIDPAQTIAPRRKILPLGPISRTFGHRALAIGDAAGLVKPTTGGGIYYTLISSALAAEVLCERLRQDRLDEASLEQYQKLWKQRLHRELRAQHVFRRIAERVDDGDIDNLFELARIDGILPLVRQTLRFNFHADFILKLLQYAPARRILLRRFMN